METKAKKLPKKPKNLDFSSLGQMDSDNWEMDFWRAIQGEETDFDVNFNNRGNLGDSSLNTPEEEKPDPFSCTVVTSKEGHPKRVDPEIISAIPVGAFVNVIEDSIGDITEVVSVTVEQSSEIPTNAIVLANGPEADHEECIWGNLADEDNALFSCAAPKEVEGIEYCNNTDEFENNFDEGILYGPIPSDEEEEQTDILQKAIDTIGCDFVTTAPAQDEDHNIDMNDPEWLPEEEYQQANTVIYAKKTKLQSVERVSMKKRVGRPCRTEPIKITELPEGIKRGRVVSSEGIMLSPEQIDQLRYRRMRDLNNEASKKCRAKRKTKLQQAEHEMSIEQEKQLQLKKKVEDMESQVYQMKKMFQDKLGFIPAFSH